MKIAFTGSRKGLTPQQKKQLLEYLVSLALKSIEAHHGMCVGADEDFHHLIINTYKSDNRHIVGHPPTELKYASSVMVDLAWAPADYLARDKALVEESDVLIACPNSLERLRSGTWATVRYAEKINKQVTIIYPDGRVKARGGIIAD